MKSLINVLLIESYLEEAKLIKEFLGCGKSHEFHLKIVTTLAEAQDYLANSHRLDAILLDWCRQDCQGLGALGKIKAIAGDIPIVILGDTSDPRMVVELLHRGAEDYLLKGDLDKELLIKSLQGAIERQKNRHIEQLQLNRERQMCAMVETIRRSLNLSEVLQTIVCEVQNFLEVEQVLITRFQTSKNKTITVFAQESGENFSTMAEIMYNLEQQSGAETKNILGEAFDGSENILTVPIRLYYKKNSPILWGKLAAFEVTKCRLWQNWEKEFLRELMNKIGVAIQQAELYQKVKSQATIDDLTGLANRRQFMTVLNKEWQRLARENKPLSLIICDIDYFKSYNDTYGHPLGDETLKSIAQVLKIAAQRSSDLAARYGGEEFALVLPNTDQEGAMVVAEKIRLETENLKIPHQKSRISQYVTMSLGIATIIPHNTIDYTNLVKTADKALYKAKFQGRNQSCPDLTTTAYNYQDIV